jgi:hypothetical protein
MQVNNVCGPSGDVWQAARHPLAHARYGWRWRQRALDSEACSRGPLRDHVVLGGFTGPMQVNNVCGPSGDVWQAARHPLAHARYGWRWRQRALDSEACSRGPLRDHVVLGGFTGPMQVNNVCGPSGDVWQAARHPLAHARYGWRWRQRALDSEACSRGPLRDHVVLGGFTGPMQVNNVCGPSGDVWQAARHPLAHARYGWRWRQRALDSEACSRGPLRDHVVLGGFTGPMQVNNVCGPSGDVWQAARHPLAHARYGWRWRQRALDSEACSRGPLRDHGVLGGFTGPMQVNNVCGPSGDVWQAARHPLAHARYGWRWRQRALDSEACSRGPLRDHGVLGGFTGPMQVNNVCGPSGDVWQAARHPLAHARYGWRWRQRALDSEACSRGPLRDHVVLGGFTGPMQVNNVCGPSGDVWQAARHPLAHARYGWRWRQRALDSEACSRGPLRDHVVLGGFTGPMQVNNVCGPSGDVWQAARHPLAHARYGWRWRGPLRDRMQVHNVCGPSEDVWQAARHPLAHARYGQGTGGGGSAHWIRALRDHGVLGGFTGPMQVNNVCGPSGDVWQAARHPLAHARYGWRGGSAHCLTFGECWVGTAPCR